MSVGSFTELLTHVGHSIEVVTYGPPADPANVAVECETCGTVLLDFDAPEPEPDLEGS